MLKKSTWGADHVGIAIAAIPKEVLIGSQKIKKGHHLMKVGSSQGDRGAKSGDKLFHEIIRQRCEALGVDPERFVAIWCNNHLQSNVIDDGMKEVDAYYVGTILKDSPSADATEIHESQPINTHRRE